MRLTQITLCEGPNPLKLSHTLKKSRHLIQSYQYDEVYPNIEYLLKAVREDHLEYISFKNKLFSIFDHSTRLYARDTTRINQNHFLQLVELFYHYRKYFTKAQQEIIKQYYVRYCV